jgi:hypothetical protein
MTVVRHNRPYAHRVNASNAGQAPGGQQYASWSTSLKGNGKF